MNDQDCANMPTESLIEDLTVNEEQSEEVKGGLEADARRYSAVVFVGGWGSS